MGAADILTKFGTKRAPEVVELAALAGLELAAAAVLLEKESGGGQNIYGHDAVETGGFYQKGGPVTKANYKLYKEHRASFGAQGVGPCQLTFPGFQDRADARGGCHDWRVSALVGFEILSANITALGVKKGFRAFNGSGPAADKYANDAMDKLRVWRDRLEGSPPTSSPTVRPVLKQGDSGALVLSVQKFMNKTFPLYSHLEVTSKIYGPETSKVIAEFQHRAGVSGADVNAAGRQIAGPTWAALEFFGFH